MMAGETDKSDDIRRRLERDGVEVVVGRGRLDGPQRVVVGTGTDTGDRAIDADVVLVATGAAPRTSETAQPDGERIVTWEQVYRLHGVPEHLVVVGSGCGRGLDEVDMTPSSSPSSCDGGGGGGGGAGATRGGQDVDVARARPVGPRGAQAGNRGTDDDGSRSGGGEGGRRGGTGGRGRDEAGEETEGAGEDAA